MSEELIDSKGARVVSRVLVSGKELLDSGECLDLTWEYLYKQMYAGGMIKEGEVLNQVDMYEDGIKLVLGKESN